MGAGRLRAWVWSLGATATLGLGWSLAGQHADGWGLAVAAGLIGLLGFEAVALIADYRDSRSRPSPPPGGARPADGVVEAWPMRDIIVAAPDGPSPWRQFDAVASSATGPIATASLPRGNLPLLGHVALISVFVGRDGRAWSDREVAAGHRSVAAAGRWLEREASRHAVPLNIGLADTFFRVDDPYEELIGIDFVPEGDDYGPLEVDATVRAVAGASRAAARLGFRDVADLVGQINGRIAADAHIWLFHLKRRGRSLAVPVGDRIVRGVGLALCYSREASFPEPLLGPGRVDPTTVVHELMHLFGATDKYGVSLGAFPAGEVDRRDIMRLADEYLDRLRVGRLTAREIGWVRPGRNPEPSKRKTRRPTDRLTGAGGLVR